MAEKKKYRFKGHESFTLREGWLNKGLNEVAKNNKVFSTNYGADALGVGPNMAKSIRYWLRAADLTTENTKTGVTLTDLGTLILENDPYIEDIFTLWLVHCHLATNRELATAWYLFFHSFSYEEFDKNELYQEMKQLSGEFLEGQKVAEGSVIADCDAILHMYQQKKKENNPEEKNISPFARLGLIREMGGSFERKQPDLNHIPEEVLLCLMAQMIRQRNTEENQSIFLEDLLTLQGGPGRLLQLKRTALMELLERLEAKEKITINRTAGLNMVYFAKPISPIAVAAAYYEESQKKKETRKYKHGE